MTAAEALVGCGYCGSAADARCVNPITDLPLDWPHLERVRAAA